MRRRPGIDSRDKYVPSTIPTMLSPAGVPDDSAYDNLVDEGKIGTGADQVAAGDHTHSGLVTGGDAHDHNGGDGAQIAYSSLSGTPTLYNQTVEDEGTPVTQRATMNFVGAGVAVTDVGSKTTVTISGGGGSGVPDTAVPFLLMGA